MPKQLIDLAALPARAMNLAPRALGPGHLRLAAEQENEARLYVYGDIGGWYDAITADSVVRELATMDGDTELHAHINSPGGSVFEGIAIYNALAMHKGKVIVHIDGIAASIASVIAMAGDEIHIGEAASFMVHSPWTIVAANAKGLRKEAEVLDVLEGGLLDIYASRTGADREALAKWLDEETWFRGQAAVDAGFASALVPAKTKEGDGDKKKALLSPSYLQRSAMLPLFKNTPVDLLPADEDGTPEVRTLERLLRDAEGLSAAQAKRVIAMTRALHTGPRDESRQTAPAAAPAAQPAAQDRRDDGLSELKRLTAALRGQPA
jgi:ATP-dependent protease ClpP protease subunit